MPVYLILISGFLENFQTLFYQFNDVFKLGGIIKVSSLTKFLNLETSQLVVRLFRVQAMTAFNSCDLGITSCHDSCRKLDLQVLC